jgi:hypothetical protein
LHRCTLVRADEFQFGFLLLTSTSVFQLGSGSGLDIIKYPTCSNTCPLVASLMKTLITITFLFAQIFAFSQDRELIDKAKITNDSLKTELFHLRTKVKKLEYDNYLCSFLYRVDTIYKTKDSTKICYLAKDKKVIREIFTTNIKWSPYTSDSLVKSDSIINFYNPKGLLEYSENWSFISGIAFDSPEQGMTQYFGSNEPYLQTFIRIEYDNQDKEILAVLRLRTLISRIKSIYNDKGVFIDTVTESIEENQFWQ